jgi:prolyl-tRNA synthetase
MPELPPKASAFIDWYLAAVDAADLTDKRYPVKGMNVWTTYGILARRRLDRVMEEEIEATGSHPVEFPLLIPETEFRKEGEHIKGFDAQVYWVTRGGQTTLDVPLVLRPTSETAMYPIFRLWVRSHSDLPLNRYQIVNTFRYETKTTRPFLRVREIHFFEEHSCQLDEAAATDRVQSNLAAFAKMAERFRLPYLAIRRPDWDKFPGAFYSIALDIPVGGVRTLQIGSIHHYRENFSRPYQIQYEAADGSSRFVHQTTFGLSERLIGAMVAVHGDERGVAFSSEVSPYQVVVVPVPSAKGPDPGPFAREVAAELTGAGLRVHIDERGDRPGAKYYYWETRGAPLRLEIGPREAAAGQVSAVTRLGARSTLARAELVSAVRTALAEFDRALGEKALAAFQASFSQADSLDELVGSTTVRLIGWCGREECGHQVEQKIDGALLGTIEGPTPVPLGPPPNCIACGQSEGVVWAAAAQPL